MSATEDEEVGYKKPPKSSQYKKGKSGNPNGRPKKQAFHEALIDVLNKEVTINGPEGEEIIHLKKAFLLKLGSDAVQGKPYAARMMVEILKNLQHIPPI